MCELHEQRLRDLERVVVNTTVRRALKGVGFSHCHLLRYSPQAPQRGFLMFFMKPKLKA